MYTLYQHRRHFLASGERADHDEAQGSKAQKIDDSIRGFLPSMMWCTPIDPKL